jgi:hypothetical protein
MMTDKRTELEDAAIDAARNLLAQFQNVEAWAQTRSGAHLFKTTGWAFDATEQAQEAVDALNDALRDLYDYCQSTLANL